MSCDKLRLEQLASGQLPLPTSLLLHWHTMRCPSCRSEYRRAQQVLSQLRSMAEEPTSDSLRQRTLAAVSGSSALPDMPGSREKVRREMRRLTMIAICATLLIAVTGAVAARFFFYPSMGCTDHLGRSWQVTGNFHGEVIILDARGDMAAILANDFGEMKEPVEVTSSGETVTVQGHGRHEIRGKDGTLYGYAVLRPVTEKEFLSRNGLDHVPSLEESLDRQARDWAKMDWDTHGGAAGSESAAWGVRGFDTAIGLRWRMFGRGSLQILDGAGKTVLASAQTAPASIDLPDPLRGYANASVPEILVNYGARTWTEQGYGRHVLKDDDGAVVLVLEVHPAAR